MKYVVMIEVDKGRGSPELVESFEFEVEQDSKELVALFELLERLHEGGS